jgi:hypothetical protein
MVNPPPLKNQTEMPFEVYINEINYIMCYKLTNEDFLPVRGIQGWQKYYWERFFA